MPQLTATVETAANPVSGPWTTQTALRLESLALRVFPAICEARIVQQYGWINEGNVAAQVLPLDLRGSFVRVTVSDGTTTRVWFGYCPTGTDAVRKTYANPVTGTGSIPSGTLTWTVLGWEHFLRSMTWQGCWVPTGFLRRVLPFNVRRGRGDQITGNRAAVADTGAVVPQLSGVYRFDPAAWDLWKACQAIRHILACAVIETGLPFVLSGQTTELDLVDGAWDIGEGVSYADAIRRIANPEYGWAMIVNGTDVSIGSISDVAVGDLPANPNVVTLDLENTASMDVPRINFLETAHYDTITVRGEPLRVMLTLSVADGTLEADWLGYLAGLYQSETTDAGRRQDQYAHLWSRFSIPDAWDGLVPAVGGGTRAAFPAIVPATGAPHATEGQAVWARDIVFDRTLPPLLIEADAQPGEPLVFVDDQGGTAIRLDEPPDDQPGARAIGVCDDRPGILVRAPYRHMLAANLTPAYSGQGKPPLYEYLTLQATISAYTNDRVRISVAALTAEPGQVNREKIIDIPGMHLWMILKGTMTDTNTFEPDDRILRDDRATLTRVAALARAWYGRSRASISVTYRDPAIIDRLGHVISEVRSAGVISPAGTMITDIAYNLTAPQSVSLSTELFDLDFARIYGAGKTTAQRTSRLARVEEELANIPVRQGPGMAAAALRPAITWSGTEWTVDASGWQLPQGMNWYAAADATLTLPGTTGSCGLWVQVAYMSRVSYLWIKLRLASDVSGASFQVAAAGTPTHLSPFLYAKIATVSRNATTGVCTLAIDPDNHGQATLSRLFAVQALPLSKFEICPAASANGVIIEGTTLTKAALGASGIKYFGWNPSAAAFGLGATLGDVDPLCTIEWDGNDAPYRIDPAHWLLGTIFWSGTFPDNTGKTVSVKAGRITGVA